MDVSNFLKESTETDPTWMQARSIVQRRLSIPDNLIHLIRSGWNGAVDLPEMIKLIGFTGLNPSCLVNAADLPTDGKTPRVADLEQSIQTLGIRLSTVILAINSTVRSILKTKPRKGWKILCQDMMTDIEIGYNFGSRAGDLGIEGGVLAGFAKSAGKGVLMAHDFDAYQSYVELQGKFGTIGSKPTIELFGCEPYQVAALALQRLGFGADIAFGTACGLSNLKLEHIKIDEFTVQWRGAFRWIEALRAGRNYPAEVQLRNLFPALRPPTERGAKNPVLEMLYIEVVRVRKDGSHWTWHLPKPDYEATRQAFDL